MDAAQRLSRLQEALTLLESGQNRQAERICRQLLDRDRGDIEALLLLGLAVGARGEADAAAPILNRVARARSSERSSVLAIWRACWRRRARRHSSSHSIARAWR